MSVLLGIAIGSKRIISAVKELLHKISAKNCSVRAKGSVVMDNVIPNFRALVVK